MKNFRFFTVMVASLLFSFNSFAQNDPQKETVIVDLFSRITSVPVSIKEGVRGGVLQGFIQKGRFNVVDAETNAQLMELNKDRNTEEAVDASNVLNANSESVYKALGAKYLVTGCVVSITHTKEKALLSDKLQCKSLIKFTLNVHNIIDGATVCTENLEVSGYDDKSYDSADNYAVSDVAKTASKFVDRNFKFETFIEALESVDKKKGVKELYVVGGTEMGVQKNQLFKVYAVKKIGSRTTKQEIGQLKAIEPMDGITKCTVLKGGIEINDIFNNQGKEALVVISDKKREGLGGFLGVK
ncbi:MAG: hypothetical protein KH375_08715 [Alistipes sp.]|nr:hypothetical protein [Alistipes sp.]